MECHKCPHRGKFAGVPFKSTPCSDCELPNGPRLDVVGYDDRIDPGLARYGAERDPPGGGALCDVMPVSVLVEAFRFLLRLAPDDLELFRARYCGESVESIAVRLGVSFWTLRARLRRILRKNPALSSLVRGQSKHGPSAGWRVSGSAAKAAGKKGGGYIGRKPGKRG